jgi:hypothetical protein
MIDAFMTVLLTPSEDNSVHRSQAGMYGGRVNATFFAGAPHDRT